MFKVLSIEDSEETQIVIKATLKNGVDLFQVASIEKAKEALQRSNFDLILLDIGLPDGDGLRFCSELKNNPALSEIPIIILTSNNSITEKTLGFQLGIEDYVSKPFDPQELKLRVVSRLEKYKRNAESGSILRIGDLELDLVSHRLFRHTEGAKGKIELSSTEFKILSCLAKNPDHVKSREQIISFAWGEGHHLADRTVDSHVSRLRKKIASSSCEIEAISNSGYRLTPNSAA